MKTLYHETVLEGTSCCRNKTYLLFHGRQTFAKSKYTESVVNRSFNQSKKKYNNDNKQNKNKKTNKAEQINIRWRILLFLLSHITFHLLIYM